ncbi:MAG: porin [Rhodobacteraceae bacterium]|nr:porin [Paracoccaceae bacterium]
MKKLLLASTAALVATAGVAAADVTLSGDGWMGVTYDGSDFDFKSRARVTFTLSGETDTGLAFGGSFRADNADDASSGEGGSVFISGAFGKLSMGDVDNALQATRFNTPHLGVLEETGGSRGDTLGHDAIAALYEYSMDDFTVALSAGQPGSDQYSIGARWSADGFGVALGWEDDGSDRHWMLSGQASIDMVTAVAYYGRSGGNDQYGLSLAGSFDDVTVTGRYKRDFDGDNHFGIGAVYDLGGGARLGGEVNKVEGESATAHIGLAFSF